MDIRGYIQHRIDEATESGDSARHFLNSKGGRPLLFFSVYLTGQKPKPEMTKFLLEQDADIKAKFEGKTVIESLMVNESLRTGSPHLDTIKLLLDYGADPNSRYIPHPGAPEIFYPLIHTVAHMTNIDLGPRLQVMKKLKIKGADLNGTDFAGRTLVEVLYWGDKEIPPQDWDWLLRHGAKITQSMVSARYHKQRIWNLRESFDTIEPSSTETGLSGIEQRAIESADEGDSLVSVNIFHHWVHSEDAQDVSDSIIRSGPPLNGLCDRRGRDHRGYDILQQCKFRRREYYTQEAAQAAQDCCKNWFGRAIE